MIEQKTRIQKQRMKVTSGTLSHFYTFSFKNWLSSHVKKSFHVRKEHLHM